MSSFLASTNAFPSFGRNKNELGDPKCKSGENARARGRP